MTTRERWTVYPLLFLAIGLALRGQPLAPGIDGMVRLDALEAALVVCRELRVDADDGTTLVHGGRIEIRDGKGRDVVAIGTNPGRREGGVEFFETDGRESARLTTTGLGDPPPDDPAIEDEAAPSGSGRPGPPEETAADHPAAAPAGL